jgi:hypothetical protein
MARPKEHLIDDSEVRRQMRALFLSTMSLVNELVTGANKDGDISAAKLQSLLKSMEWLKSTYDSFQKWVR